MLGPKMASTCDSISTIIRHIPGIRGMYNNEPNAAAAAAVSLQRP